jgi:hypothetical protein
MGIENLIWKINKDMIELNNKANKWILKCNNINTESSTSLDKKQEQTQKTLKES